LIGKRSSAQLLDFLENLTRGQQGGRLAGVGQPAPGGVEFHASRPTGSAHHVAKKNNFLRYAVRWGAPAEPSLGHCQSRDEPHRILPIDVAHVRCGQIKTELRKLFGDPRARSTGREIRAEQDVVARHQLE
jgi:hypothetical protein